MWVWLWFADVQAVETGTLVSPARFVDAPAAIDPDAATLGLLMGMAPRARGGGATGLWARRGEAGAVSLGLSGVVELHATEVASGVLFLPWQAYRAHVGLDARLRLSPEEARWRWFLDLGLYHESDHEADHGVADAYGLDPEDFPNITLSTFEYVLVRPRVAVDRWLTLGAAVRVFTPNALWIDQSRRVLALAGDVRVSAPLTPRTSAWCGAWTEGVLNDYDAPLPADFRGGAYRTTIARAGLSVRGDDATFEPLLDLRVGNGRGVDFAIVHPLAVNLGFEVQL